MNCLSFSFVGDFGFLHTIPIYKLCIIGLVSDRSIGVYFYHESLDPEIEPRIKVTKSLTYGLVSSGNQAETAIRMGANLQKEDFPGRQRSSTMILMLMIV